MMSTLLGIALASSGMTQLRLNGVGPSELLILSVIGLSVLKMTVTGRHKSGALIPAYIFLMIQLVVFGSLAVAFATIADTVFTKWLRQITFILMPMLLPILYSLAFGYSSFVQALKVFSQWAILIYLIPYAMSFAGIMTLGGIDFYYGPRYLGWSQNPNQTALVLGVAVPMLYYFMTKKMVSGLRYWVMIVLGIAMGLATKSDALLVCWIGIVGFVFLSDLIERRKAVKSDTALFIRAFKILLTLAVFVAVLLWARNNAVEIYDGSGAGMGAGQGQVRVLLWMNAFSAFLDSPVIGHGHGHFSGLGGPYNGSEAHNFYFDWLAAYGIVGIVFFAYLILSISVRLTMHRKFFVLALLFLILALSLFHFYGRHPVFWTMIYFCGLFSYSLDLQVPRNHADGRNR